MSVIIGHASINENGEISGGKAGDQTGQEVTRRTWYDKPWDVVIRPKSSSVAEAIATAMEKACANDNIGYCQSHRTTAYTYAKKVNYDLSKITTPCEADCSSLVALCILAAGINVSPHCTTRDLRSSCLGTGQFTVFTDSSYTRSTSKIKRGDILLNEGHHTAIVLNSNYTGSELGTSGLGDTSGSVVATDGGSYAIMQDGVRDPNLGKVAASQAIKKKHTVGVDVSAPYATIEIYTETDKLSITQTVTVKDTTMANDILSIVTNRDMAQDCPTFTITISYQREWYSKISSNDLVIIKLCRPPEINNSVFFGLIDDVRCSNDYTNSNPSRSITVTGRGFAKAFARFEIGTLSELNALSSAYGFGNADLLSSITKQPPAKVVELLINEYLSKGFNYKFSNGEQYSDYFRKSFSVGNSEDMLTDSESVLSYDGSLWNILKEVKDAPFNEMFWEVVDNKPTLIFRRTPFDETDWTKLYRIQIPDTDIISENVGKSDTETYTIYKCDADVYMDSTESVFFPIWYPPYYSKYGISRLNVTSKYFTGNEIENSQRKSADLYNWNVLNNAMENGTITVKGRNIYKVGTRVIIESTGIEYYVEAVSHTFTFFQGWTTTLSVTRGIDPTKRYASPVGEWKAMTPADTQKICGYVLSGNGNSSVYSATGDSSTATAITKGTTITIPSGLGSVHTFMGWQMITAKSSTQYKLREKAGMNFDSEGFGKINGRYVIACTTTFGKVGDYVDFYQTDGIIIKGIIGDIKNQSDAGCNKWGHTNGRCIVEFVVDKTRWYGTGHQNPGTSSCHPEWNKNITKAINGGSYFG